MDLNLLSNGFVPAAAAFVFGTVVVVGAAVIVAATVVVGAAVVVGADVVVGGAVVVVVAEMTAHVQSENLSHFVIF